MNDKIHGQEDNKLSEKLLQELLEEIKICKNNTSKLLDLSSRILGSEPLNKDESNKTSESINFVERLGVMIVDLREANTISLQALERLNKFI